MDYMAGFSLLQILLVHCETVVCMSKYRWHWDMLEAVCLYDVGSCVANTVEVVHTSFKVLMIHDSFLTVFKDG